MINTLTRGLLKIYKRYAPAGSAENEFPFDSEEANMSKVLDEPELRTAKSNLTFM
jgi:hypothetical protein